MRRGVWRKSSKSNGNGGNNCVECMWTTSSYCTGGNCLEARWKKSTRSHNNGTCLEARWQKSSFSGGSTCLEARHWTTSTRSGPNCDNCVECQHDDTVVNVRDTKNREGGMLTFPARDWAVWIAAVRDGAFDFPG